jgi:DNA-binding MarR family transcriptional regulator
MVAPAPSRAARKSKPSLADYRAMAEFRLQLRRFLAFSTREAEAVGIAPQQYQALLAMKGHKGADPLSVTELAEQLLIRQHTAGELVTRMEAAGLVRRRIASDDRRRVELTMTKRAEDLLADLAGVHLAELQEHGPAMASLLTLIQEASG